MKPIYYRCGCRITGWEDDDKRLQVFVCSNHRPKTDENGEIMFGGSE